MLDTELHFFLKTQFGNPSVDFKLSDEDNTKLFEFLQENCEEGCLQDQKNLNKVKQAFREYFEPVGYILFKINEKKILLKVFPYRIEPKDSINLPALLDLLEENKELIEYDYKGNKNQMSLPTKLKNKLFIFVNKIDNEEINKKELVRYAVNEFFKLKSHDIVIIKDQYIFVKKLHVNYKRKIDDQEKDTIANRYNGIKEEELKSLYDDFFSKEENKHFFYYTAKLFVKMYMLDKKIDNYVYEQKVFSLIQGIIADQMNNAYNHDQDFCTGFSGYVFRIHFEEVFAHIAHLMLAEIAASNEYMTNFVKYYSLNVIVLDGKRYKVPELITKSGRKWNVVSMLSIVKIYIKTKKSVDGLKKERDEMDAKIRELYIGNYSPLEYQNNLIKEITEVDHRLIDKRKHLDSVTQSLQSTTDKEKEQFLRKDMMRIKDEIQKEVDERKKLEEKHVPKNVMNQYSAMRKEFDDIVKHLQRDEKILEQNTPSYLSIEHALTKALVSKKTLVG